MVKWHFQKKWNATFKYLAQGIFLKYYLSLVLRTFCGMQVVHKIVLREAFYTSWTSYRCHFLNRRFIPHCYAFSSSRPKKERSTVCSSFTCWREVVPNASGMMTDTEYSRAEFLLLLLARDRKDTLNGKDQTRKKKRKTQKGICMFCEFWFNMLKSVLCWDTVDWLCYLWFIFLSYYCNLNPTQSDSNICWLSVVVILL